MPKRIPPLSDVKVRTAKPHDTEQKNFDGGCLFLLVTPSDGKLWHFKYRFVNKERKLDIDPEMSAHFALISLISSALRQGRAQVNNARLCPFLRG